MRLWLLFLLVISTACLVNGQIAGDPNKISSFYPHYYCLLPIGQVDSLLHNLSANDSCQITSWQNNGCRFWQFAISGQCPDMLIIRPDSTSAKYIVFSKSEYTSYFGWSIKFIPWQIDVGYKSVAE